MSWAVLFGWHITEVPELKIPFPGVWEISYHARSATSGTPGGARASPTPLALAGDFGSFVEGLTSASDFD
ncbi:Putative secreted protein [Streptomyces ambofaciens ATCC 23877]|uniref:Putative secreted protein n=1 Tax=Streptomyces ambofaciens (strain ATCC 23877 / 3486 / DSM 40053 / JCM 4204 / NBRC 12836 / NRRL B-2516) TaxID=278992 RepID=A0A0K2AJA0_STRA7|nr:Putative secreted protein [Streptomyces ambofaciens ATCC 23877]AKZ60695.1 Putative secreted protein [Streptomyces ambofaciens ATCC 23877]